MIEIKRINEDRKVDINMPNEAFSLWGKMIVVYNNAEWTYTTEVFEESQIKEMTFPDENYDFDTLKSDHFFVGAYNELGKCIGLAIFRHDVFKYLYLSDLKVSKAYRGQSVGRQLIEEGLKVAAEDGYRGIYTIGQHNNLSACLFYISSGFLIGGLDTRIYSGTSQADKHNIYFYFDASQ